jgi:hypothetical protein
LKVFLGVKCFFWAPISALKMRRLWRTDSTQSVNQTTSEKCSQASVISMRYDNRRTAAIGKEKCPQTLDASLLDSSSSQKK